jgi:hypothetical protein
MSTINSPLVWKNAFDSQPEWFTSDDLCFPASESRERLIALLKRSTEDHLGVRKAAIAARSDRKHANNPVIQ